MEGDIDFNRPMRGAPILNCTPFVRQYGILKNKWGDFNAKGSSR